MLIKYSSAGVVLWTKQTGSTAFDSGQGVALSADGTSIYVAGYTSASLDGQSNAGS